MSLSKTHYPLLRTGSAKEDPSRHNSKVVDWDVRNQNKQTHISLQNEIKFSYMGQH